MRAICAIFALLMLAGCMSDSQPEQPTMYLSMANGGATLDPQAAASMISQYRQNNGLGKVVVDPDLMKLAEAQSTAMAGRNKLDHDVKGPLAKRLGASGYPATVSGRKRLGRLPHACGSLLRLARFAAAPGQYAGEQCHKIGHCGELCSKHQIQGVLDAHSCINGNQINQA